jgi:hypothetical protein
MTDPQHRLSTTPHGRLIAAVAVALVLVATVLAGCALVKPAPIDPLAAYRPALRPDFTLTQPQIDALLRYSITVQIDPPNRVFTGTADITIPVSDTLPDLYFRLYPNLPQFDGNLQVSGAHVNGKVVGYAYAITDTAVHLALPEPLQPGTRAQVHLSFNGKALTHNNGYYTIFGHSEDILSLTNFYPILAGRRNGNWALDFASPQGDVGFHDAALYQVHAILPTGQVVVASGTATGTRPVADGLVTMDFVQGPAREFTMLLSPRFQVEEADAYGTHVRSFYLPEDAEAGHSALYDAVAAVEIYSDEFGPYPYRDMAVVEAPLTFHGMEFPGLSLVGSQTYNKFKKDLEMRVAHEVGHQWWYNQVGSDQIDSPWQDEGLTEYSMYFYFARRYGVPIADAIRRQRWEVTVQTAAGNGADMPIGRPVSAYPNNYEIMVYAKGALFFANLRDTLGPDVFNKFLRTYLARYSWRIARPADVQQVAEEVSGKDLGEFFQKWLQGTQ